MPKWSRVSAQQEDLADTGGDDFAPDPGDGRAVEGVARAIQQAAEDHRLTPGAQDRRAAGALQRADLIDQPGAAQQQIHQLVVQAIDFVPKLG